MQTIRRQDVWWREVTGGERWECDGAAGRGGREARGEKMWADSRGTGVDWFSSNILIFTLLLASGENIWLISC